MLIIPGVSIKITHQFREMTVLYDKGMVLTVQKQL